ncbi:MAG: methyltransferase domain-containing protein [Vicinamibacterales bacterium]
MDCGDDEARVDQLAALLRAEIRKHASRRAAGAAHHAKAPSPVTLGSRAVSAPSAFRPTRRFSSHRRLVGRAIVLYKRLFLPLVRAPLSLYLEEQATFNAAVSERFAEVKTRLEVHEDVLREAVVSLHETAEAARRRETSSSAAVEAVRAQIQDVIRSAGEAESQRASLEARVQELERRALSAGEALASLTRDYADCVALFRSSAIELTAMAARLQDLAGGPAARTDELVTAGTTAPRPNALADQEYFEFQQKFRGSEEYVRRRQAIYLEHFANHGPVVDIGCGRGEFLSLLREAGIAAVGVDSNAAMVHHCLEKGLVACLSDAATYLSGTAGSIGGIFCSHVLEHLRPADLLVFLRLCRKKLEPGGILVIETVNPCCLSTHASFAADPGHERPLHPDWLAFLLETSGLQPVSRMALSPHPEAARLATFPWGQDRQDRNGRSLVRLFNDNVEKLNELLFGCRDYAIVARAPSGPAGSAAGRPEPAAADAVANPSCQ